MTPDFKQDEINIMCIYGADTRLQLIAKLEKMQPYLGADQAALRKLSDSAISKLKSMTDEQFLELNEKMVPDF